MRKKLNYHKAKELKQCLENQTTSIAFTLKVVGIYIETIGTIWDTHECFNTREIFIKLRCEIYELCIVVKII